MTLANVYDMRDAPPAIRLPLEVKPFHRKNGFPWSSCPPFVENARGTLIHRPRHAATFNLHDKPHIGINFWCGMQISTNEKNLSFLSEPPDGRIVCERCESIAVENCLPSSDELAGRHVHKGRTKAVATCCHETGGNP